MRRRTAAAFALSAVLAIAIAALASAASVTVRAGQLLFTIGGSVSPKKLPRNDYAPVRTTVFGKITTSDGSHPPALREAIVDIDKDAKVDVKGYPVCKPGKLEARDTGAALKVCGEATIGNGVAHAEIAFPEQPPITVESPITVFNGGQKGGKTLLLIHTFITVPVPAAIVTQVTVQKKGRGLHTVALIPVIAGGSGSAIDFSFKAGKTFSRKGRKVGVFEAKCPDGKFIARAQKILFKNEAKTPGFPPQTIVEGTFIVPCTPKG
jgi:hypothetical protein